MHCMHFWKVCSDFSIVTTFIDNLLRQTLGLGDFLSILIECVLVGICILLLLNSGDMEMARLSIVVPMIINDKLRNRLSRYTDNTIVENIEKFY